MGEICTATPRFLTSSAIPRFARWRVGRPESPGSFAGHRRKSADLARHNLRWASRPRQLFEALLSAQISRGPRLRGQPAASFCPCSNDPVSRSLAAWPLFLPSSAANIMRARRATHRGVLCRLTSQLVLAVPRHSNESRGALGLALRSPLFHRIAVSRHTPIIISNPIALYAQMYCRLYQADPLPRGPSALLSDCQGSVYRRALFCSGVDLWESRRRTSTWPPPSSQGRNAPRPDIGSERCNNTVGIGAASSFVSTLHPSPMTRGGEPNKETGDAGTPIVVRWRKRRRSIKQLEARSLQPSEGPV